MIDIAALSTRRLAYLSKVLEKGSVRAAAQALNVDASVVSRAIAALEQDVGATVLRRNGRGVAATEIGDLVAAYGRRQLTQQGQLIEQIRSIQSAETGHVELVVGEGFVDWLAESALPDVLFSRPGVTVNLTVASSDEIIARITDEQADLGLIFLPPENAAIRSHAVVRSAIHVLTHAEHPLAELGRPIRLTDLLPYRGVLLQDTHGVRQIVRRAEVDEGVTLSSVITTNSFHAMHLFAIRGIGYGLTASPLRRWMNRTGRPLLLPLENRILHDGTVHLVSKQGRTLSPSVNVICQALQSHIATLD